MQFAISIALIFGTLVLFKQLQFVRHTDLGFDKENAVLIFFPNNDPEQARKYGVFRDELLKNSGITSVSGAFTVPGVNSRSQMSINKKGFPLDKRTTIQVLPVDYGFVKALGLNIVAGRDFSPGHPLDAAQGVILNETAVSTLGLNNPVGEVLLIPGGKEYKEATVIGVVKNFHIQSLHQRIEPCVLLIKPDSYILAVVKMRPGAGADTLSGIHRTWDRVFGGADFNLRYLKDRYDSLYQSEEKSAILLVFFMSLVLLLSCIGLLGLASFVISRRTKEIGVRKVFGASILKIVWMLSFRLVRWIWLSCLIAWPLAYYFSTKWLEDFAYKISLGPMIFLVSGGAALLVALCSIHCSPSAPLAPTRSIA